MGFMEDENNMADGKSEALKVKFFFNVNYLSGFFKGSDAEPVFAAYDEALTHCTAVLYSEVGRRCKRRTWMLNTNSYSCQLLENPIQ